MRSVPGAQAGLASQRATIRLVTGHNLDIGR
jgi:hypothetical protein